MATSGPTTTVLNGIEVKFPFEPYQIQKGYMGQVIRSLKLKKNALLESPTGTGKTLSILCAALSWLNSVNKAKAQQAEADDSFIENDFFDKPTAKETAEESDELNTTRIYFSSRTHSQLSQSIKELKKTNYNNNSAIVLAGRDLLCLNEDVNKLDNIGAKNQACKSKIGANCSCKYYKDYEQRIRDTRDYKTTKVIDVEDLVEFGKKHSVCPYFASKYLQKRSEVIFLPYNYLLDPKIRRAQKISLNDDVVIFDEGHNIEKTCEESVSVDLRSDHLATCIREMGNIYQFYNQTLANEIMDTQVMESVKEFSIDDLLLLKMTLDNFEKAIDTRVQQLLACKDTAKGGVCNPEWIFNVLSELSLTSDNIRGLSDTCDKLQAFLTCILPIKGPIAVAASSSLNSFKDFLSVLAPEMEESETNFKAEFKTKFRVYIEVIEPEDTRSKTPAKAVTQHPNRAGSMAGWLAKAKPQSDPNAPNVQKWVLHIWCLSPSVGLKGLIKADARSIILTSGTLAPLDSFEAEFDTKFECRIQNNHIISAGQMAIFPVSYSFSGVRLDSSFNNRSNTDYYRALGDTVVDICKAVPDGVLLFFSSYSVMTNSINKWKENDGNWKIWTELNRVKTVFSESRNRDEFNEDVVRYRENVNYGKGSIFFGICRGKLSEGIDLSNAQSRGVILIGLPYPAWKEPRVILKRSYLDVVKHPNFTSNTWYMLQMKRALNQAIGRAIRHKNDYGCVFLLDHRFENQVKDLSKWCVPFVRRPSTFRDMMTETKKFFESNRTNNSLRKQAAIVTSANSSQQAKDDESIENKNVGFANLDFSLSEYGRNKKKSSKGSKKRVYDSDPDDKKQKRAKQIASQKVDNVFDLIQVATSLAGDETRAVKKERKHLTVEYDEPASASSRPAGVLADNGNFADSSPDSVIILLDN